MKPISKGKAARGGMWDDRRSYQKPSIVFDRKTKVSAGTFMMNPKLSRLGLSDDDVWDDVPLNMQLRTLHRDGTTTVEKGRLIQNDEPFFVTGEALVSSRGDIVLVQVIPSDGYPGWVELNKVNSSLLKPGSTGDIANDTVAAWFCQRFEEVKKKPKNQRG